MPKLHSEDIVLWRDRIISQRESGLSIASWCQQNKVRVNRFHYWRKKFFAPETLDRPIFSELLEEKNPCSPSPPSLTLQFREVQIILHYPFESRALIECLKILKEVMC